MVCICFGILSIFREPIQSIQTKVRGCEKIPSEEPGKWRITYRSIANTYKSLNLVPRSRKVSLLCQAFFNEPCAGSTGGASLTASGGTRRSGGGTAVAGGKSGDAATSGVSGATAVGSYSGERCSWCCGDSTVASCSSWDCVGEHKSPQKKCSIARSCSSHQSLGSKNQIVVIVLLNLQKLLCKANSNDLRVFVCRCKNFLLVDVTAIFDARLLEKHQGAPQNSKDSRYFHPAQFFLSFWV